MVFKEGGEVNYDAELARLVDFYSTKVSLLTGKPEHRKVSALRLLREMAEGIKKIVREGTLEFYEEKSRSAALSEPLFTQRQLYIPNPAPGTPPPIIAKSGRA